MESEYNRGRTKKKEKKSGCEYLDELIACVHIVQLQ